MELHIKNMVCSRCIMVVRQELENSGLGPESVELGKAVIGRPLTELQKEALNTRLSALGFELIDDKKGQLTERIKNEIVRLVYDDTETLKTNFSDYISKLLMYDYKYLSHLFTAMEGHSIEHYFIAQKIARVKELLEYGELSLTEISLRMNYSSVAHLSRQFKKTTGQTPSDFRRLKEQKRLPIEKL